ncbi:MAG: hypothetical protein ACYTFY_09265, partial [Planctomycetota bacterium]
MFTGHDSKIKKVASFGGTNFFKPEKAPATHCSKCPEDIYDSCPYKDKGGFVFPVGNNKPFHKNQETAVFGGDLCVFNDEFELVDNQTIIFEWDDGVRGNFNLQLFQHRGCRELNVWGEKGRLIYDGTDINIEFSNGQIVR